MFLSLTLTCLGWLLVTAENGNPAKMLSFTSSHLPDYYAFSYEMDDGTLHKEEGRLMDGVWTVVSQFSCSSDDSPMQTFSFLGNKCGFNRPDATSLGLNDKIGEAFMESVESHGQPFHSRNAVPFSNDTDIPLRIGLPISQREIKFLINTTADISTTIAETDVNSHFLEMNSSKESNTTDDRSTDSDNRTHPKLHILKIPEKNVINNSDLYTNEMGSPESGTPNKSEESVQQNPADLPQPAGNSSTQGETKEMPVEDKSTTNSSVSVNTKTESENQQVSTITPNEQQGNHSQKHPIIKRVQIIRHPENPDTGVNVSVTNNSELLPDDSQLFSNDQLISNNRSSNFQVFFKKAGNMTIDSESHNLFLSSDDINEDTVYNNSRSFLEALLKTENVPYTINTEAIPVNKNSTSDVYTTPLPEVKVEAPVN